MTQPSDTPRADQWADLRALAEAVTPGPWYAKENIAGVQNLVDITDTPATFVVAHTDEPDSGTVLAGLTDYIAAVSPMRVLDLLAALAEAERQVRERVAQAIEARANGNPSASHAYLCGLADAAIIARALSGVSGPTTEGVTWLANEDDGWCRDKDGGCPLCGLPSDYCGCALVSDPPNPDPTEFEKWRNANGFTESPYGNQAHIACHRCGVLLLRPGGSEDGRREVMEMHLTWCPARTKGSE